MITTKQLEFYNSLTSNQKYVLHIAVLRATTFNFYEISRIAKLNKKITDKEITSTLRLAYDVELLNKPYSSSSEFMVTPPLMIFVYPELEGYSSERKQLKDEHRFFYYHQNNHKSLGDFLHCLLFDQNNFQNAVKEFYSDSFKQYLIELTSILEYDGYKQSLKILNADIITTLVEYMINSKVNDLTSLSKLQKQIDEISRLAELKKEDEILTARYYANLFSAKFDFFNKYIGELNPVRYANAKAIEASIDGKTKDALQLFEATIKSQRKFIKGAFLPSSSFSTLFYMVALLNIESAVSAPIFQKIINESKKKNRPYFNQMFLSIAYFALNDKVSLETNHLDTNNFYEFQDVNIIFRLLIDFITGSQPNRSIIPIVFDVVKKAYENGYKMQAYEAAYALHKLYSNKIIDDFYFEIEKNFTYKPIVSRISIQSEWEKSLNSFLAMSTAKTPASKDNEGKNRVVYYVNMNNSNVQPVLQTRTAKGGWSSGRNIALLSFYQGKTEGMTEQDYRIAKHVKTYSGYYGKNEYQFSENVIKELVGHPYIFLVGSNDLPIELIAAQPTLKVEKVSKGYSLTTDIKDFTNKIIVQKETNTRYKIYEITSQQQQIIKSITEQKIVVPEEGKEKLMQVLGIFSSHLTIHSDLVATNNADVKKVNADSRVRVQLLPLGGGLKAELFAKPFGNHPPYCKPGKGGKTLIANENGNQLQVTRNMVLESEYENKLLEEIQALESIDITDDLIAFENPLDSLNLLDILTKHQDKCVVEWPEGEKYKIRGSVGAGNLNLRLKSKTAWFELQGELRVDESTVLSIQQLLELTDNGHNRFIELRQGEFLALSESLKKQLQELRSFSTAGKDGLQINKFASVALGDFFDDIENLKVDKQWKEFRTRVDNVKKNDAAVPTNLMAELRPYQEEGFKWLSRLAEWEGGACLADDMGLGKTIQTLAILLHRAKEGAALVVCPVSVIHNWISETAKFAPTLNVKTLSSSNREQIMQNLEPGDLLITSYGLLQSEEKAFAETTFATIVLDEAHVIKNFTTKTSKAAMQLKGSFRIALTGTPIQNHLGEVWNLFNFINPGLLGTLTHFNDNFIKTDNEHARKHLKKLITPFILRRTKSAVLDELPPKTEIVKKIQLSDQEMAFYEALRRQAIVNLESDDSTQGTKHLKALVEITRLRQACCNPALVDPNIKISSTKLSTFLEIVTELIDNKHKALVFSQFVTHLAIVREALDKSGINYQYLDGSTPMAEREKSVKKFQSGEGDLFLISLKAGGLGLNLTAADYVIHMDPWWNPAVEDQASDRAHRYGQSRPVTIYRIVAENTIEEKIIQLHSTKRDLAESLLEGSDQSAKLSINELVSLIKDRD